MDDRVDHGRRRLLIAATAGTGSVGLAFAAYPFLASWSPSARARALGAPVEVDVSKIEPGRMIRVAWRGQPIYVVHRTRYVLEHIGDHDDLLVDPLSKHSQQPPYIETTGAVRARRPEYWVGLGVCTHLGCAPLGAFRPDAGDQIPGVELGSGWPGGFYCPCHGSKYDISGRVFKNMPAPRNLTIPPYAYAHGEHLVIGVNEISPETA